MQPLSLRERAEVEMRASARARDRELEIEAEKHKTAAKNQCSIWFKEVLGSDVTDITVTSNRYSRGAYSCIVLYEQITYRWAWNPNDKQGSVRVVRGRDHCPVLSSQSGYSHATDLASLGRHLVEVDRVLDRLK